MTTPTLTHEEAAALVVASHSTNLTARMVLDELLVPASGGGYIPTDIGREDLAAHDELISDMLTNLDDIADQLSKPYCNDLLSTVETLRTLLGVA
jgi:hypothetical protein